MTEESKCADFTSLGLDPRLVTALSQQGLNVPTAVQIQSIPVALERKDILMRAKTGSGKTLAYSIPLIENLLRSQSHPSENQTKSYLGNMTLQSSSGPKALILAPTRELINQTSRVIDTLTGCCNDVITCLPLNGLGNTNLDSERPRLQESPRIVIATPARLANHLKAGNVSLTGIESIVIDEADLMMTHDFENDIKEIVLNLSSQRKPQIIMCSATLNPHTTKLQNHFLIHHPTVIQIDKSGFDANKLSEYYFETVDFNDKFLVMYALFKLNIIKGKSIVFVHNIDLSYRLKLFLEKFLIPSAVLNPTLPYNSRQSVIDKFNRGLFQYLITTDAIDEHDDESNAIKKGGAGAATGDGGNGADSDEEMRDASMTSDKANTNANSDDDEYDFDGLMDKPDTSANAADESTQATQTHTVGLAKSKGLIAHRGVDFREVAAVINFSSPYTLKTYLHRIGRTARAGNYGVGITLVTPREMKKFRHVLFARVKATPNESKSGGSEESTITDTTSALMIEKLPLSIVDLEAFRYRCNSVRCSITTQLVRHARLNELRMEVLNSKRLQSHFEERKREYELLRHDKMLQPAEMVRPHMSHVPSYLVQDTNLKIPNRKSTGSKQFKKVFGELPPVIKQTIVKNRLRQRMKGDPGLRRAVNAKRIFKLKHPNYAKSQMDEAKMAKKKQRNTYQSSELFNKATLVSSTANVDDDTGMDRERVYRKKVNHWRTAFKPKMVSRGRRKPSMVGMGKTQIRMLKKRQKLKKLGKRSKK